jgi:hypothetical protein
MGTVDELFDEAKRLKPEELLRLAARLDEHVSSVAAELAPSEKEKGRYARTLALSGTGHADWSDVSARKGKHLADTYAARRDG